MKNTRSTESSRANGWARRWAVISAISGVAALAGAGAVASPALADSYDGAPSDTGYTYRYENGQAGWTQWGPGGSQDWSGYVQPEQATQWAQQRQQQWWDQNPQEQQSWGEQTQQQQPQQQPQQPQPQPQPEQQPQPQQQPEQQQPQQEQQQQQQPEQQQQQQPEQQQPQQEQPQPGTAQQKGAKPSKAATGWDYEQYNWDPWRFRGVPFEQWRENKATYRQLSNEEFELQRQRPKESDNIWAWGSSKARLQGVPYDEYIKNRQYYDAQG